MDNRLGLRRIFSKGFIYYKNDNFLDQHSFGRDGFSCCSLETLSPHEQNEVGQYFCIETSRLANDLRLRLKLNTDKGESGACLEYYGFI